MDDVLSFRNHMAEQGIEFTPAHAAKVIESSEQFRQRIHDAARQDPSEFERLANLSLEEKKILRKQLAAAGQKMSMTELDGVIGLVLSMYEQEKW